MPDRVDATSARLGAARPRSAMPAPPHPIPRAVGRALGVAIRVAAHAVTGVRAIRHAAPTADVPRVYFANHASHGDIVLIRATLPKAA